MKTLYVTRNGATIAKEVLRFIIRHEGETIQEVPIHDLSQIVIVGKAEITHDALVLAFRNHIDILMLTQKGDIKAHYGVPNERMIHLRMAQHNMNTERQLNLARQMVLSKIGNCRAILQRRQRKGNEFLDEGISSLKDLQNQAQNVISIPQLMGVEGSAANIYFQSMPYILGQDLGFRGRNRRPPRDPVNALLSFGYALLFKTVARQVTQYGLDPYLGCLHSPKDRRMSLVLDLMEEFRPILVDRIVLTLVNRVMVQPKDFVIGNDGGINMSQRAIAILIQAYEDRLSESTRYGNTEMNLSWRLVVQKQVALYRRCVLGEAEGFSGVQVR